MKENSASLDELPVLLSVSLSGRNPEKLVAAGRKNRRLAP
jgi:hypothetical protein